MMRRICQGRDAPARPSAVPPRRSSPRRTSTAQDSGKGHKSRLSPPTASR
ncbi:hypothetical protein AOX55_00001089 [Sinorhizobium fredii CCBAU 25509]|nr:hypothetical protein SF83666_c08600 [Sinorhizobium fredii CCBAU 83666]AWM24365.1 hypothetical protein AOX55_00001089 [Sinorhizobium fredii CCBAU 25509]